jgi:hypothetical protein
MCSEVIVLPLLITLITAFVVFSRLDANSKVREQP